MPGISVEEEEEEEEEIMMVSEFWLWRSGEDKHCAQILRLFATPRAGLVVRREREGEGREVRKLPF